MKILEDELKDSVLHDEVQSILSKYHNVDNKAKVMYEKSINYGRTIADCLVIDTDKIIGIELKTAHDNLKRLKKQLTSYLTTCNLVYVYVADKHVQGVLDIIDKTPNFSVIGVISYDTFDGEILSGVVRKAKPNPNYNLKICTMALLQKDILYHLVNALVSCAPLVYANTFGKSHYGLESTNNTQQTSNVNSKPFRPRNTGITTSMSKGVLANILDNYVTPMQGVHMICDILRNPKYTISKNLVMYDVNGHYIKGSRAYNPGDIWYDKKGRKHITK